MSRQSPRNLGIDWNDPEQKRKYHREYIREYRKNDPTWRKQERLGDQLRHMALKDEVFAAYGGYICACCGEAMPQFLSIDHINNDGAEHRRHEDRRHFYRRLRQKGFPPGFQVLCMNCNFGKARNGGVCPHKSSEGSSTISKESTSQANGDGSAGHPWPVVYPQRSAILSYLETPVADFRRRRVEDIVSSRGQLRAERSEVEEV